MSWSALFDDRTRLELELRKAGTRISDISLDVCDVPELRAIYGDEMNRTLSQDARLRLALDWFGDQGQQQPPQSERTSWHSHGYTREFGRLHRLEDASTSLPALPPLPNENQLNSCTHASLEKAVRSFDRGGTRGDAERGAKLPPPDARRVRLMFSVGLFHLNADCKLIVDSRVARKGSKYVLRYLDDSGTRWLDPDKALRGR